MGRDAPSGGADRSGTDPFGSNPRASDQRPSDLPASYRNPWEALAEDLRAVVADARLRLREVWRRNGEGDLWRPAWWPRDLAPLFWPLLAAGALALVAAVLASLMVLLLKVLPAGLANSGVPPSPTGSTLGQDEPGGQQADALWEGSELNEQGARTSSADGDVSAADGVSVAEVPSDVSAAPEDALTPGGAHADGMNAPDADDLTGSDELPPPVDPLKQLLDRPEAAGLVEAAVGEAEAGTLTLQLTPGFDRLSDSDRRRRAELWRSWAIELGYDHLELRDRRSGLRGRDALVGDGMILFSLQPPP